LFSGMFQSVFVRRSVGIPDTNDFVPRLRV